MCERFLTLLSLNWPMGGLAALFDRQRTCVPLSSCRSQDRIPSDIDLALYSLAMNRRCPCGGIDQRRLRPWLRWQNFPEFVPLPVEGRSDRASFSSWPVSARRTPFYSSLKRLLCLPEDALIGHARLEDAAARMLAEDAVLRLVNPRHRLGEMPAQVIQKVIDGRVTKHNQLRRHRSRLSNA